MPMVGAGYKKNVLSFSAEFIDTGINGRDILIGSPQCFQVLGRTQWAMVLRRVGMSQPEEVHGGQLVFKVVDETLGHCAVAREIRTHIERFGLRELPARTEAPGSMKDMSAVRRILNISGAGRGIAVHPQPARRLSSLGKRRNAEHMTPELAAERKERGYSDIEEPELSMVKETKLVAR